MIVTIDPAGRVLIPKSLRQSLGLEPGAKVDVTAYGAGLSLTPLGRTARLVRNRFGHLVGQSDTKVSEEMIFALIDQGRR
ncbi:MAG: AbrB/MazE/SpoVT family DNA-binding domain-containing protein [Bifidobacteriaceae bacterium]|jgi:AbrB family looped-hinge helix DNA binding protein|nr:AbrB/MazE/SpoVT family DNA-binding domain-containing protein [Bifidobacteriaceae bacterium]